MKSAIIKALALVGVAATGTVAALHVQGNVTPGVTNAFAAPASADEQIGPATGPRPTLADLADEAGDELRQQAAAAASEYAAETFPVGQSVPAVRGQNAPTVADEFADDDRFAGEDRLADDSRFADEQDIAADADIADQLPEMPPVDDPQPAAGEALIAQFDGPSDPFAAGPTVDGPPARGPRSQPTPDSDPFGDAPPPLAPQPDAAPIGRASLDSLTPPEAMPVVRPAGEPVADFEVTPSVGYQIRPANGDTADQQVVPASAEEFEPLPADPPPFAADFGEPPTLDAEPALSGGPAGSDPFAMEPAPERTAVVPPSERPVVPRSRGDQRLPSGQPAEPPAFDLGGPPQIEEPMSFDFGGRPDAAIVPEPRMLPEPGPQSIPDRGVVQELNLGGRPTEDEYIGDGIVDRNVPRGSVRPQLEIQKVAPPKAAIGEKLVYTITVTNTGETPARSVVVEDRIPRGSTLDGTNPVAEMPKGQKALIWRFEEIAPGQSELMKVRVTPTQSGSIGSIATVRFIAETAAETRIAAPQLSFRLVGPKEAILGETVTYRFEIANTGDGDAQEVVVRTLVPEGLKHPGGIDLEYPVGVLTAGAKKTVDLPVQAVAVGENFNTRATLESRGNAPVDSVSPIRVIKSRLDVGRAGPGKRIVNSDVSFVNRVTNTSIKTLTKVRVTETLPAGTKFLSATAGGRLLPGGNVVEWIVPQLGPGESKEVSVKFRTGQAGTAESIVSASAADGSQAGIRAKMAVIGFAALKVEADHEARPFLKGEQISVRMRIRNGGSASARNVATTMKVPPQLKLVSVNSPVPYKQIADTIQFETVNAVGMGETVEVDLVFDAIQEGAAHFRTTLQSSELQQALVHDEALRVYVR